MARYEFRLPDIGEGVAEGEIVCWLVAPGQVVQEDEPMVEVMTDKATVTIDAPRAGRIVELCAAVGESIGVGKVLVVLELQPSNGVHAASAATACGDLREELPGVSRLGRPEQAPVSAGHFDAKPLATPATRRLARELGLDLRTVVPTGRLGRVSSDDVRTALLEAQKRDSEPSRAQMASPASPLEEGPASPLEERVALRGLRKRTFESMAVAKRMAAHATFVEECNVTALKAMRERLKPKVGAAGARLSFLPFIVKAAVAALKRHPALNATFDEARQEIVTRRYYNIGIATATEDGLVVPVLKQADRLSLLQIARAIEDMAERARAQALEMDDVRAGTFTISSMGHQGGLFGTPILHYPEVAILGVHQIKQRPIVKGGQIVVGDVMLLSLSFDHRLVDGHVAAAFAYELIGYLEEPETLLLET